MLLIIDCCFLSCKSGSIKVKERLRAVAMAIALSFDLFIANCLCLKQLVVYDDFIVCDESNVNVLTQRSGLIKERIIALS